MPPRACAAAEAALEPDRHVDEFVATCQVGITIASLGIGFLGEPALAELLEPVFGGVSATALRSAISIAIAFTIVTFLHMIVGEQAPKMLAIARAETVLLRVARPLNCFRTALHPLIVATNAPANFLVRGSSASTPADLEEETSPEELRLLIIDAAHSAAASTRARRGCSAASSTCTSRRRAR